MCLAFGFAFSLTGFEGGGMATSGGIGTFLASPKIGANRHH